MKNKSVFLFFILLLSCKRESTVNDTVTISQVTSNYDSLIYKVKAKGDTTAYDELFYGFMDANELERTDSVMVYSKIMAKKYNYEKAYFDYLKALCEKNDIELDYSDFSKIDIRSLSDSSREIAIGWLGEMLKNNIITQEQYKSVKK